MNLNEAIIFCDSLIENNKEKIINKVSDMMLTQVFTAEAIVEDVQKNLKEQEKIEELKDFLIDLKGTDIDAYKKNPWKLAEKEKPKQKESCYITCENSQGRLYICLGYYDGAKWFYDNENYERLPDKVVAWAPTITKVKVGTNCGLY